ncbi:allophanate hydrolase subunit 1 [Paenibacillus sp. TRM 82003]|uniref:5-oxoprolinase subunit B family protein n=1 Tax=Kineococcus sp. TRM81007 TaxID=2925831 RepID=UPI001F564B1C|nr:allophanate hydrolase subunit 1 [Kineococcus sp. TRM81007]MCI2238267.1 allophanate hydrolase subunit 1 [Kineococcus sp. TRM81007]MCI3924061.1 allophanate hydrolase subunit 1 [Paenibacillus sp. TRM 82003]
MSAARLLPAGDRAWLLEPADPARLAAFARELERDAPAGVEDVLPAARTALVTLRPGADRDEVAREVLRRWEALPQRAAADQTGDGDVVTVPVRYDGEDLDEVAGLLGVSPGEVVARHTGATWTCAFVGFAPGFGYLRSPGARLAVPRRAHPRTAVPAGAVALADGFSAVYPRRSPGGWRLIGTTALTLWDASADPPALLRPGTRVRFAQVAG